MKEFVAGLIYVAMTRVKSANHLKIIDFNHRQMLPPVTECINREFKQIATAGAATAIVVKEVWGEYFAVARQNSTLSNAKYK